MAAQSPAVRAAPQAGAADEAGVGGRIAALRLKLVAESVRRMPVALFAFNAFAAWMLWRTGWQVAAVLWFAAMSGLHTARWALARRWLAAAPADPARANRWLAVMVLALAALLGLLILLIFSGPHGPEHYIVTTLAVGMASGAPTATGWRPGVFRAWALLVGGALIGSWLLLGDPVGLGMAVLVLGLLGVLLGQTRDQQRALREMVRLAWDNEQLAASLRVERDRAQAASESKTRFFAAASHDLRQPLHALSINAYALATLARRHGEPRIVKLSDSIERALRQSTGLLDGLLDVSRLDAGAVRAEWSDIDLGPLLDSLAAEFRRLAAQGGLALAVQCPDEPLVVRSDADLLRRVLTNLLGNALKFTRQGGVTLIARPDGDHVLLAVEDTGIGISAADQTRVFEEFYQADNPARDRSQGLGLGLAIVRRIALLLDIGLQLDSAPGRGTRITLRLPPGDAAGIAQPFAADIRPPDGAALGLRVLVIDDEADIRDSMQALLEQLGCEAVCVEDLAAAQARVRAGFAPQVLLTDHRLRQGDGLAALAALRAELGPLPAMLVTGDTAPATLATLAASGHRVLHKPVDGATLAQALRDAAA